MNQIKKWSNWFKSVKGPSINYVVSRGEGGGVKNCQFYLVKRRLRGVEGVKNQFSCSLQGHRYLRFRLIHLALLSFCFAQLSYPIILFVFGFLGKIRLFELVKHAMLTKIKKKKVSLTSFCNFTYQKIYVR